MRRRAPQSSPTQPYAQRFRDLSNLTRAAQAIIDESTDPDVQYGAWLEMQAYQAQMRACLCYAHSAVRVQPLVQLDGLAVPGGEPGETPWRWDVESARRLYHLAREWVKDWLGPTG